MKKAKRAYSQTDSWEKVIVSFTEFYRKAFQRITRAIVSQLNYHSHRTLFRMDKKNGYYGSWKIPNLWARGFSSESEKSF